MPNNWGVGSRTRFQPGGRDPAAGAEASHTVPVLQQEPDAVHVLRRQDVHLVASGRVRHRRRQPVGPLLGGPARRHQPPESGTVLPGGYQPVELGRTQ